LTDMRGRDPIRVLLGELPDLLRSVLCDVLADQPDIEIVTEDCSAAEVAVGVRYAEPDVIVVGVPDQGLLRECRSSAPANRAALVGVGLDGREVVVYHDNLSPHGLRDVIRACGRQEGRAQRPSTAR